MEELENKQQQGSGIYNYFQGATIHNIVINGNMSRSGTENYYGAKQEKNNGEESREVNMETIGKAVAQCGPYFWGNSAIATVFCVCRDIYKMGDNASWFERQMEMMKIDCPQGTIANAFRNNPYMKLHVDKWEKNGAKGRVLVLMRELQKQVGMLQTEDVTDMATT